MINGTNDWSQGNYVEDIVGSSNSFCAIKLSYILKMFIRAAHRLAKFSFDHDLTFEWTIVFSSSLDRLDIL